jgi:predicted metal-dependent peptidase
LVWYCETPDERQVSTVATPHSIEKNPPKPAAANDGTPVLSQKDITKAARYTLISMHTQSIGRLAMQYSHVGTTDDRYIAYATAKKCVYGRRFALMDRFSQAFVMAHETFHHVLGHIPMGAILYKREPKRFSFKIFNIACDAIINHVCSKIGGPEKSASAVRCGVRRCQELGIVNWEDIQREMQQMSKQNGTDLDPVFEMEIQKLNSQRIYHAMMGVIRRRADQMRDEKKKQDWEDLLGAIQQLVVIALRDPSVVFVNLPIELGANDLYDALADLARTYLVSEKPGDLPDAQPATEAQWQSLWDSVVELGASAKAEPTRKFTETPVRRARELWNDLVRINNAFNPSKSGGGEDDGEGEAGGSGGEDSIIDRLARDLNAHDDLREAIEKAAEAGEGELLDEFHRSEEALKRAQAGAGKGDAILECAPPDGMTRTPWTRALRRMLNSALVQRISVDPTKPSRRTIAAGFDAFMRAKNGSKNEIIHYLPRVTRQASAKRLVMIWDTSGSMFADREMMTRVMRETVTTCKRVNAVLTIIQADAAISEEISVGEAYEMIRTIQPKGGGGTDFRPAIARAMELRPDAIIYLTDLMGTFPEKAPKIPLIWAYPPEFANIKTPWGQRLELVD